MTRSGMNRHPKAIAASERNEERKRIEREMKKKEEFDEMWKDDDKINKRKEARKNEKEEKRLSTIFKKQNKKLLLEEETQSLLNNGKSTPIKVTRKEIEDFALKNGPIGSSVGTEAKPKIPKNNNTPKSSKASYHSDDENEFMKEVPQNLNRLNDDFEHARGIEDAISVLKKLNFGDKQESIDRNPEKRQNAAFKAYSEREMFRLKIEEPTMTYSQKKQLIYRNWQKSPENPVYQKQVNQGSQ